MNREQAKRFAITFREWLLILLLAVLLHLFLFFVFSPIEAVDSDAWQEPRFTLLLDPETLGKKDPYHVGYWLKYTDPESFFAPDPASGFSIVYKRDPFSYLNPPEVQNTLFQRKKSLEYHAAFVLPKREMEYFSSGVSMPPLFFNGRQTAEPAVIPKVKYPLWIDEKGILYSGLFYKDDNSEYLLRKYSSRNPTELKILFNGNEFPLIVLLKSCGVRELDMLAKRQLSSYRGHDFGSFPVQEKYYTVIWNDPMLKNMGGSK